MSDVNSVAETEMGAKAITLRLCQPADLAAILKSTIHKANKIGTILWKPNNVRQTQIRRFGMRVLFVPSRFNVLKPYYIRSFKNWTFQKKDQGIERYVPIQETEFISIAGIDTQGVAEKERRGFMEVKVSAR